MEFTAKTYLYGPTTNANVVRKVQSDLGSDTEEPLARNERITITPNPASAKPGDDFGFTTTIDFFSDVKRYNPETGTDS